MTLFIIWNVVWGVVLCYFCLRLAYASGKIAAFEEVKKLIKDELDAQ